ncbi:MAG TPA: TIGR04255 family protein [Chromatiales bacterium]|nr:TIGR04255 family protein [Chromatiales bacterium]HDO34588.1 TIGR04255 family protein [Chromatiales bacterium]
MASDAHYPKLKNQPLSLVLAEFRFSEIAKISDYIPEIQERLRKQYPDFKKKLRHTIQLNESGIVAAGGAATLWTMVGAGRQKGIQIESGRLIYFCSAYDRFPGFQAKCMEVIRVLIEVAAPGLLHRVGLRYNDLVLAAGNDVNAYLNPSWHMPAAMAKLGDPQLYRTETVVNTAVGVLAARTLTGRHSYSIMPDILQLGLPITVSGDNNPDRLSVVLDFDHFWESESGVEFAADQAKDTLGALHEPAREAFWKTTTEEAKKRWS